MEQGACTVVEEAENETDRWDLQKKDGAGSKTLQFELGVLKWSQLHLEFWSGAAPPGVGTIPNRP
jgi:hypothetical protein